MIYKNFHKKVNKPIGNKILDNMEKIVSNSNEHFKNNHSTKLLMNEIKEMVNKLIAPMQEEINDLNNHFHNHEHSTFGTCLKFENQFYQPEKGEE